MARFDDEIMIIPFPPTTSTFHFLKLHAGVHCAQVPVPQCCFVIHRSFRRTPRRHNRCISCAVDHPYDDMNLR